MFAPRFFPQSQGEAAEADPPIRLFRGEGNRRFTGRAPAGFKGGGGRRFTGTGRG